MIKCVFFQSEGLLCGFEISGHAGAGTAGNDIVCAAVSSAAYMTVNTLSEILKIDAEPEVGGAFMKLALTAAQAEKARDLLKGFELHIIQTGKANPGKIKVVYGGQKNA